MIQYGDRYPESKRTLLRNEVAKLKEICKLLKLENKFFGNGIFNIYFKDFVLSIYTSKNFAQLFIVNDTHILMRVNGFEHILSMLNAVNFCELSESKNKKSDIYEYVNMFIKRD